MPTSYFTNRSFFFSYAKSQLKSLFCGKNRWIEFSVAVYMTKEQTNRNQKQLWKHFTSLVVRCAMQFNDAIIQSIIATRLMRNVLSHWYLLNRQSLNVFVWYMRYQCFQLVNMPEMHVIWIKMFWLLITGDFFQFNFDMRTKKDELHCFRCSFIGWLQLMKKNSFSTNSAIKQINGSFRVANRSTWFKWSMDWF